MHSALLSRSIRVLIVEDNPADVFVTKEALKCLDLQLEIDVLANGESALAYLSRESGYGTAVLPDVVILDLNLPKVGGQEVLEFIRGAPELRNLRVVVLSSSPEDVVGDVAAQASCYIQKPPTLDEFLAIGPKILTVLNGS